MRAERFMLADRKQLRRSRVLGLCIHLGPPTWCAKLIRSDSALGKPNSEPSPNVGPNKYFGAVGLDFALMLLGCIRSSYVLYYVLETADCWCLVGS